MQRKLSPFLKSVITLATLSCSGKTPFDIERLMRYASGFLICLIDNDRILFEITSGSGDLFLFNRSTFSVTSTSEKGEMVNLLFLGCFRQSRKVFLGLANFPARFFPTVQKRLFIHSAIFWLSVVFLSSIRIYPVFYPYLDLGFPLLFATYLLYRFCLSKYSRSISSQLP